MTTKPSALRPAGHGWQSGGISGPSAWTPRRTRCGWSGSGTCPATSSATACSKAGQHLFGGRLRPPPRICRPGPGRGPVLCRKTAPEPAGPFSVGRTMTSGRPPRARPSIPGRPSRSELSPEAPRPWASVRARYRLRNWCGPCSRLQPTSFSSVASGTFVKASTRATPRWTTGPTTT